MHDSEREPWPSTSRRRAGVGKLLLCLAALAIVLPPIGLAAIASLNYLAFGRTRYRDLAGHEVAAGLDVFYSTTRPAPPPTGFGSSKAVAFDPIFFDAQSRAESSGFHGDGQTFIAARLKPDEAIALVQRLRERGLVDAPQDHWARSADFARWEHRPDWWSPPPPPWEDVTLLVQPDDLSPPVIPFENAVLIIDAAAGEFFEYFMRT